MGGSFFLLVAGVGMGAGEEAAVVVVTAVIEFDVLFAYVREIAPQFGHVRETDPQFVYVQSREAKF